MEKKQLSITKIIMFVIIIILAVVIIVQWVGGKTSIPSDYKEMTAGQLLDLQLEKEKIIEELVSEKKEIQKIRDEKTASIRGEDIQQEQQNLQTEETPSSQLNEVLNLQ